MLKKCRWILMDLILILFFGCLSAQATTTLTLPEGTKEIHSQAFYGNAAIDEVMLPEGLLRIEGKAFAQSSLKTIILPESLQYIADDAFGDCSDLIAFAPKGTYAFDWCAQKGLTVFDATGMLMKTPKLIYAEGYGAGKVAMKWEMDAAVDGIYLHRSTSPDFDENVARIMFSGARNIMQDFELSADTVYYYRLQAFVEKADGTVNVSRYSEPWSYVYHADNPRFGTPSIERVDLIDHYTLHVSWECMDTSKEYQIIREDIVSGVWESVKYADRLSSTDTMYYMDTGLLPKREYQYTVATHLSSVVDGIRRYTSLFSNGVKGKTIVESVPEGVTFRDGVVSREADDVWQRSGDYYIVPENEPMPVVGQIITFGMDSAICVESVEKVNGKTRVGYSTPELYEFLEKLDLEGTGNLDFSQFRPNSGVSIRPRFIDLPEDEIGLDIAKIWDLEIDLGDNWVLGYSVSINCPSVTYKVDTRFGNPFKGELPIVVNDAFVYLENEIEFSFSIGKSGTTDPDEDGSSFDDSRFDDIFEKTLPIGSVPIVGVDGLALEIEFDLVFTAEGKFEVTYKVAGIIGARVVNNQPRNITDLASTTSVGLCGEVTGGLNVELDAEVFGKDIISFGVDVGIAAGGSVHLRDNGLVCMDATVNPFITVTAFEDTLIDDWLEIALSWEVLNADNSPLKFSGHWENMQKVPACTYGEMGTIRGTVANADNRTQYISGAKIEVEGANPVYSDANGQYEIKVPKGPRVVRISANGYLPFDSMETVMAGEIIYLQTYLMVEGDEDDVNATGKIGGQIINSVTGGSISGVKMTIRKGWNVTSGNVIQTVYTNTVGKYEVTLPIGNYCITLERDGYLDNTLNVAVTKLGNLNYHQSMTPDGESDIALGDMRIILTWGSTPSDLDSHLRGPAVNGAGEFHVYYNAKNYYANGVTYVNLDRDDTSSYGPETTTVYDMLPNGVYSFYVHDYSNRSATSSMKMANSGAEVQVLMGDTVIATYHIPTSGVGTVWHVFDFDSTTRTIKGINQFWNESNASEVGR